MFDFTLHINKQCLYNSGKLNRITFYKNWNYFKIILIFIVIIFLFVSQRDSTCFLLLFTSNNYDLNHSSYYSFLFEHVAIMITNIMDEYIEFFLFHSMKGLLWDVKVKKKCSIHIS